MLLILVKFYSVILGLVSADIVETWRPPLHPRSEFIYVIGVGLSFLTCSLTTAWGIPSTLFASSLVSFGGCCVYLQLGYDEHCKLIADKRQFHGHETNFSLAADHPTLTQLLISLFK